MWSNAQWLSSSPYTVAGDGWPRNCCSLCQDEQGSYHTKKLAPPSNGTNTGGAAAGRGNSTRGKAAGCCGTLTLAVVEATEKQARKWLQWNIHGGFWQLFSDYLDAWDREKRAVMIQINIAHGLGCGKTLRKWMSYSGAVRVWPGVTLSHWTDSATGENYVDCGHLVYAEAIKSTWPQAALANKHADIIDDTVEAFFGFAWKCRSKGITQKEPAREFVRQLELLCFAIWLRHNAVEFKLQ